MTNTTLEDAQYCLAHPDVLHTPAQHREIIKGLFDLLLPVKVQPEMPKVITPIEHDLIAPSNQLGEIIGCFDAAIGEGLYEAIAETTDERLKDLLERRVMHAYYTAIGPEITPATVQHEVPKAVTPVEDLSPEGINRSHGKPVWRCFGCKAETSLHWYHGWSVAMCRKPECAKAYDDMVAVQIAGEESYEAHCREIHG